MKVNLIETLIKKEDDTKAFQIQLMNDNGTPFAIPQNANLEIDIESKTKELEERYVEIIDYQNGIVRFDFMQKDVGNYSCEIIIRFNDMIYTFPTDGYFNVQVNRNLNKGDFVYEYKE